MSAPREQYLGVLAIVALLWVRGEWGGVCGGGFGGGLAMRESVGRFCETVWRSLSRVVCVVLGWWGVGYFWCGGWWGGGGGAARNSVVGLGTGRALVCCCEHEGGRGC